MAGTGSTNCLILGGGMTGLAAGWASGLPVYESRDAPGGICSSYYVRAGERERLGHPPADGEAYRFEVGGGHWIFGGDALVLAFIRSQGAVGRYGRKSSVYFSESGLVVPYPLQNHLRYFDPATVSAALEEITREPGDFRTMKEWLRENFGETLCERFFYSYNNSYTDGLYETIAPQDAYKTPLDAKLVRAGARDATEAVGYNTGYLYPEDGLDALAGRMARGCDIRYGKRAVKIDRADREIAFADGTVEAFDSVLATLPLNQLLEMSDLKTQAETAPYTSVLVLNIGATKGAKCPEDHWIYLPRAKSGFHRVGFYSNVDASFLPKSARDRKDRVSIYVERVYRGGTKPEVQEQESYARSVVEELRSWGFIEEAEVVDPTWIEVAYTWSHPNSDWREEAIQLLEENDIFPIGRYARWKFQGIADSIKDGFYAGAAFGGGHSRQSGG